MMVLRSVVVGFLVAIFLTGCTQYRLDDSAIGAPNSVGVDPKAQKWQAQAAADKHYVMITRRFIRDVNAPSNLNPLCNAGRVSQLEGADRSVAISILLPAVGAGPRAEVPILLMRGRDAKTGSAGACSIDVEGGTVVPASRLGTGAIAIGARQVVAGKSDPPIAAIAGATAKVVSFFTSGANPVVGTLAGFAVDQRVADLQALWRNFAALDDTSTFSPFGGADLTLDDIRARRTVATLPVTLIRRDAGGAETHVPLGRIELRAVAFASLLSSDPTRDNGIPTFSTGLDLNGSALQVVVAGRPGAVALWDALDPLNTLPGSRLRDRAQALAENATAAEIRRVCTDAANLAASQLGLAFYDRLAVQAAVLRETKPWAANSPVLRQNPHPCFLDNHGSILFEMGFPDRPDSALAQPLSPPIPPPGG
jgi:hypothetical protein